MGVLIAHINFMIQVATFLLPDQQEAANEFLKTHKPEGPVNFNRDMVVVFWDNGEYPAEYQIADMQEMLKANANARFQQEGTLNLISTQLADLQAERSTLNAKHNKGRVEEVDNLIFSFEKGVSETKQAITLQDLKAEFLRERIAVLERTITK